MPVFLPLLFFLGAAATTTTVVCAAVNEEQRRRTEREAREQAERTERERQFQLQRIQEEAERQLAIAQRHENERKRHQLEVQMNIEDEHHQTTMHEIKTTRDRTIAEIRDETDAFYGEQQQRLHQFKSEKLQELVEFQKEQELEYEQVERKVDAKKKAIAMKRLELKAMRDKKAQNNELWEGICKMIAESENSDDRGGVIFPKEFLALLPVEVLKKLNRYCNNNNSQQLSNEQMKEYLHELDVKLRQIIAHAKLEPNVNKLNGHKVLQFGPKELTAMNANQLLFLLCGGGKHFQQVVLTASEMIPADFISTLCQCAVKTDMPQFMVGSIQMIFWHANIQAIPDMSKFGFMELNNSTKLLKKFQAKNKVDPKWQFHVEIFLREAYGNKHQLCSFHLETTNKT